MATEPKAEDSPQTAENPQERSSATAGWGGKIDEHYRRIKEHAETYPYVWGSYILVYGGFGLWLTYRWRKLRRTEDSVRTLQARLHQLIEEENATSSAALPEKSAKSSLSTDKPLADKAT
ncbi:uncharacterized protein LOC127246654 [Andrographis paniculata]|uniref:uncharacterized protein LOC127246654 n=1 Tax=Andrographis paniculata TaxID=175694 RepID=UPI0021E87588|nr:uncharacterized protein LOC127246654 [Andrographis paniculata]